MWPSSKRWFIALTTAFIILFTAGCGGNGEANQDKNNDSDQSGKPTQQAIDFQMKDNQVIAQYEGGKVVAGDFETFLNVQSFINPRISMAVKKPSAWEGLLKGYISEHILAQMAGNKKEAEKKAGEMMQRISDQYTSMLGGDKKKVEQMLEGLNITEGDIKTYLTRYNQVESYLRSQVKDEDLQKVYNDKKETGAYTVATARHILIKVNKDRTDEEAKKLAQDLAKRIRNGEDFAKLAKEYSEDGSKENGGLLGEDQRVTGWVPAFKQAALEQEMGVVGDPVKSTYGYHIIKVEKRSQLALEEVKEEVVFAVMEKEYMEFQNKQLDGKIKKLNVPKSLKS